MNELLYRQDSLPGLLLGGPTSCVNSLFPVLLSNSFHIIPKYCWKVKTLLLAPDVSFSEAKHSDHFTHMRNWVFFHPGVWHLLGPFRSKAEKKTAYALPLHQTFIYVKRDYKTNGITFLGTCSKLHYAGTWYSARCGVSTFSLELQSCCWP